MDTLKISYSEQIPEEVINEFLQFDFEQNLGLSITVTKPKKSEWENFDGDVVSDIFIYIQDNKTEILVSGFITNIIYDLLKAGLKTLWSRLISLKTPKKEFSSSIDKDAINDKCMSICFGGKDKSVELYFEGDYNIAEVDQIIEKGLDFMNSPDFDKAYENSDFLAYPEVGSFKSISLYYDRERKLWLPTNFGKSRKEMDEMRNKFRD